MEDGAAGGAAGGDAQADADVLQDSPLLLGLQRAVARREGVHEPGLAGVEEGRGAEVDEVEDLAVAVEALLQGQQEAAVARLVAQRIAAQAAVAALPGEVPDDSRQGVRRAVWNPRRRRTGDATPAPKSASLPPEGECRRRRC